MRESMRGECLLPATPTLFWPARLRVVSVVLVHWKYGVSMSGECGISALVARWAVSKKGREGGRGSGKKTYRQCSAE